MTRTGAKDRSILFSGPMVRAILEGRKTQTRRVVKPQPEVADVRDNPLGVGAGLCFKTPTSQHSARIRDARTWAEDESPFGQPGDRLWVRETFAITSNYHADCRDQLPPFSDGRPVRRVDDADYPYWQQAYYAATDPCPELLSVDTDEIEQRWKPSIHMPRWASRLTLEITEVRVERLQEITRDDAKAEGLKAVSKDLQSTLKWGIPDRDGLPGNDDYGWSWQDWNRDPRIAYQRLWHDINGQQEHGWEANPWVWVISFRRVAA